MINLVTKIRISLRYILLILSCLMSFSASSQLIINLQGPEYAAVCDTLQYEILLDYSGDGNMPQNAIELSTDNEIEFIDVVSSPFVLDVRQEDTGIQLDVYGIPSCGKGIIIVRYLVPCYLSYKSIESSISYFVNQQPVQSEEVITQIDLPQIFIKAGEWEPSPNSNSTIKISLTNTGNVTIGELFFEFATSLNKGIVQSASTGTILGSRTLKISKSNWAASGGHANGLESGKTAIITLVFKWTGCFPDQMQIMPYFKCQETKCEDLSPAVIPPFKGTYAGNMRRISDLKLGVCRPENTYYTLKNIANDTSAYNGMMDVVLWILPNDHTLKVFEKCIESISASVDGKKFPLIYNSIKQGYQVDLRTLREAQTSMTDLDFNNKWNDLAPGDSIIIAISIQTKGICHECGASVDDRNSGFLILATYKDHCKLLHEAEVNERFNLAHKSGISVPGIAEEGSVTFVEEGLKWVSNHNIQGLEGFRNSCISGNLSLSMQYPKSVIPVMSELKYIGPDGDTILVSGINSNNQLKISIAHELKPKNILISWVAVCFDGDYTIGNAQKEACEQCMSFNPKKIHGELIFECNQPCRFESQLACYSSINFITDCKLANRILSLELAGAFLQRISTGYTDATLSVMADPLPPGMTDFMGIPGDTILFSSQFDFDCHEPLESVNLYLNLNKELDNSSFRIVSSKLKGYNSQMGTLTGVCDANSVTFVRLNSDIVPRNIKSEFSKDNLSSCLSAETDSVAYELEFSYHLQQWTLSSYRFLLEEKLDGCNRSFEKRLFQDFKFHSGLSNSNSPFPTFHSDYKIPVNSTHDPKDSCFVTPCKTIFSGMVLRERSSSSENIEFRPLTGLTEFSISFPSAWEVNTGEAGIYKPVTGVTPQFLEFELYHSAQFLSVTESNGMKTYKFEVNPKGQYLYVPYDQTFYCLVPFTVPCSTQNVPGSVRIFYKADAGIFGLPELIRQNFYRILPLSPRLDVSERAQALISDDVSWTNYLHYGVGNYSSSILGVNSRGKIIIRSSKSDLEITDFKFSGTFPNVNTTLIPDRVNDTWQIKVPATLNPALHTWSYNTTNHSCGVDTIYLEWQPPCLEDDPSCSSNILHDTMIVYTYNPLPDLVLEESTPLWTPCINNEVIISIKNKGSGGLKFPEVYLDLPEGLSIESAEFPDNPIASPEIITPGSGESRWILKFNSPEMNPIPPFQDSAQSEFRLKLLFSVAFDIELPFKWEAFLSGIRPCGDSIQSRIIVSPYLYFEESSLSNPVEWNFRMQAGPDCTSGTEMIIDITKTNQNWQASSIDSILLILEGNLIYIPGTAVNSSGQSLPDPTIRYDQGKLRLLWGGLPELLPSLISSFSFRIGHECSETCEPIAVSLALLGFQNLQCTQSPVNCQTQILQSFRTWENVRLRGNFLQQVTDVVIDEIGNQVYRMSARIGIRNESHTSYNGPVVIRLFQDNNLNNWLDPGELLYIILDEDEFNLTDLFWNWFEFSAEFPVDALCNLRIAIELPEKCQCEPSVLSIDPQIWLEGLSAGRHCAGTSMIINTDAIPFCSIVFNNNIHLNQEDGQFIFIKDLEEGQASDIEELVYQINCGVCNFSDTLYLETYQILGEILELNSIQCHADTNGSLLFKAEDDNIQLNYEWNINAKISAQLDNVGAGNFELTISDQNQCSFTYAYNLTEPELLSGKHALSSSLCDEDTPTNLSVTAFGGIPPYNIQWQSGETTDVLTEINFGSYTYTITDSNACTYEENILLDEPKWYNFEWQTIDATCAELMDGEILLDLPEGPVYSVSIDNFNLGNQDHIKGLGANEYELIVGDQTGCARKVNININNKPSFRVSLPSDTTVYLGDTLLLYPDIDSPGSYSFEWSPAEWVDCPNCENVNIFIIRPLQMHLMATNHIGCKDSSSINILVDERIRVFVPEAFSPNNDGINDLLRPYSGPEIEEILSFNIHDRWGSRVFEQNNISPKSKDWGWDGLTRNMEMQPGVFVYHLKVKLINGDEATLGGEILLMR